MEVKAEECLAQQETQVVETEETILQKVGENNL